MDYGLLLGRFHDSNIKQQYLVRAYLVNIFKTLDGRTAFINFDRLLLHRNWVHEKN